MEVPSKCLYCDKEYLRYKYKVAHMNVCEKRPNTTIGTKMNKTYTITINNLTESDMRDIFYEAIEKLGVKAGQQIPSDMVDLRETVIRLMFEVKDE